MTHEEELHKLRESAGTKVRNIVIRPIINTSSIFLITGCVLLIAKLTSFPLLSWLWVFGTMFFPFWFILGLIVGIIGIVIGLAAIVATLILIAAPFWFIVFVWKQYKVHRHLAACRAMLVERQKRIAANDMIDRR